MESSSEKNGHTSSSKPRSNWWIRRWRRLSPVRQDRFAALGSLISVCLFLAAIVSAITYFTFEEAEREKEAVTRDLEYAQQRLRLRLLERQEQLMRLARDMTSVDLSNMEFIHQSESLVAQYPELIAITWINDRREVVMSSVSASAPPALMRPTGSTLQSGDAFGPFELARDLHQPIYSRTVKEVSNLKTLTLAIPLTQQNRFDGILMAEYSIDGLLRFGVPSEVMARYAVALLDEQKNVLAGSAHVSRKSAISALPWAAKPQAHEIPVSPVGNSLLIRAEGYRTSKDTVGDAFFWMVGALSVLTVWMLVANLRHTRRRIQAQQALLAETNFRRAMENSMLTGMRALDMQGRISYVNPAFCSMTGWTEQELLGATAPFPYWPESAHETLMARLQDEIQGRSIPGGFEVPVKRRNGSIFFARMYVSPLIDAKGKQTGWMTSMTDITEPKRIREELTASYQRFTTVLDSLDEAISVAPLSSNELLFANKMYQTWFGLSGKGHRSLLELSATLPGRLSNDNNDHVDFMAGLPITALLDANTDSVEIHVPELDKWLEVRTRYLTWVDGRLSQMVIATDITSRRQAEILASEQAKRAETASRLITMGEMASSVAHELNQPLTAISNYSSGMITRLKNKQISEEDLIGALEKTARQAQRAGQVIQRIKAFVKRSEPNATPSDVGQMVNNAVELAEIELRRQMIRLRTYVATRLPTVVVDPILIEQVLINLIKNGGEAIQQAQRPPSQRQIELRVTRRRIEHQDAIEFSIQDTGTGIPPDQLDRIYEAFYSTKTEGMGIGLKLCRSIIESHHGRLQARNLYNGEEIVGCEFSFWIPVSTQAIA